MLHVDLAAHSSANLGVSVSAVVCSFEVEQDLASILALVHVSLRVGDFLETPDAVNDWFDVSTLEHR